MLIRVNVFDSVARGEVTIAVDPQAVQAVKPASEDPKMSLMYMGEKVWRVNSPFGELVDKLNNARGGKE